MNITAAGRNTVLYPIPTKPEKTEKKDNTAGISQPNEPSNVKPGQMDTFTRMTGEPDSAESENRETLPTEEPAPEDVSERQDGSVAVNEGKRARQIAAAKNRDQVRQVIALLRQDMTECKAGLERGWCDESEIKKVQLLLSAAQSKLSQVPQASETDDLGLSEFDLAALL